MSQSSSTLSTDLDTVQTPSTEGRNHADLHVDYPKKISESLISLNVRVEELSKNIQEWKNRESTTNSANAENISTTFDQLKEILHQVTVPTNDSSTQNTTDRSEIFLEQEAWKIKTQMAQIWSKILSARRQAYWHALRNKNIATKYKEWKEADMIILPQFLQMKEITNEPKHSGKDVKNKSSIISLSKLNCLTLEVKAKRKNTSEFMQIWWKK